LTSARQMPKPTQADTIVDEFRRFAFMAQSVLGYC